VYTVEDLGFLNGGAYMVGLAMNAGGDIAGSATMPNGKDHAVRWTAAGGTEDLGALGGVLSQAFGINDRGDVVGVYLDQNWQPHPFIAPRGGVMTNLNAQYPAILRPNGINNYGQLTGFTSNEAAFMTRLDGTVQSLAPYGGEGWAITDNGWVAGFGWSDASPSRSEIAFRYSDATGYESLGTLNRGRSSAMSINRDGVVAGWAGGATLGTPARGFRAKPGQSMQDLGVLPNGFYGGWTEAYSINDAGDVVGRADGHYTWTPFLYTDADGLIDLRYRIPITQWSTVSLQSAMAINDAGQIVALYRTGTGVGTWRLTPVIIEFGGPVAAPTVDQPVLLQKDNKMVSVSVDPHVTDDYDPEPICRISNVINSEAPSSGPDPDVEITAFLSVNLRATRLGSGLGRTYTITLSCTDALRVTSTANVVVTVPHDSSN
jgi:uncharacterized membrane protein